MNDKMLKINEMIADLQAQAEGAKSERQQFEEENGITDGQERMNAALIEARERHAKNKERLGIKPDRTDEAQQTEEASSKEQVTASETPNIIQPSSETTSEEASSSETFEESAPPTDKSTHSDEL